MALLTIIAFLVPRLLGADAEINWARERQFWAFQAPKQPDRPEVKHSRWPRQDLDFFVLAKIEDHGLAPNLPADRLTLLKRAAYDLTGLPPEPEVARRFLSDERADAFERLVDHLLASPSYGERMASMWLPLARYAEDQAHQVGNDTKFFYPNAYKYRRWVIDAFNRDLPYPEFIKLQLAADKFPEANTNDLPALGFVGLGPKYYNRDRIEVQADEWEDRVDTVSRTFLGLTVACARCHDHKFDPITREDYYGLAGVFASSKMINRKLDGSEEKSEKAKEMSDDVVHMVEDNNPHDLNVFIRGNVKRLGPIAPRQFIQVLARPGQTAITEGSGRKEIAEDIADWRNPLTARVIVNRLWGVMIGRPIVESPSNFGHSGQSPSNPELLDHLATRFIAHNGSIKKLMREIALSATFQQSSLATEKLMAIDPSNQNLARMNRRRLTAEQWRDSMLAFSNELEREGGKSMELDDPKNFRRTVYARISRLQLNPTLAVFDYPDANVHAEKHATTTTATQKLLEMNSEFITRRAKAFAARLACEESSDKKRIEHAYALLFNRAPEKDEVDLALAFLEKPSSSSITRWEQYAQSLLISNEVMYVD